MLYMVFLASTFASIYYIILVPPTVIEDLPGKRTIEYSAATIIAPLVATGYFLLIINDMNEKPFKIRDVPFRHYLTLIRLKLSDGLQEYRDWKRRIK